MSSTDPLPDAMGVHLVRADDLSDETPQTRGLQRFEAV